MTDRMKSQLTVGGVLLGVLLMGPARAEIDPTIECDKSNLCIDIASDPIGGEWPIEPGSYTMKIVNLIPSKIYRVSIKKSRYTKIADPIKVEEGVLGMLEACDREINKLAEEYQQVTTELAVSALNQSLTARLAVCGEKAATLKKELLSKTTKVISPATAVGDLHGVSLVSAVSM